MKRTKKKGKRKSSPLSVDQIGFVICMIVTALLVAVVFVKRERDNYESERQRSREMIQQITTN